MHRVLAIPYLLNEIFTWMTTQEITVTARVNREWFASSIPILWKKVELETALSLLGAFEDVPEKSSYQFQIVPDTKKWNRFAIYSSRILSLRAVQRDRLALKVAVSSRPHTDDPLFPQCRYVSWEASSDEGLVDLGVLITPNLDHFVLQVHDLEYSFFYGICEHLKAASPVLRFLQLDIVNPSDRTADCRALAQDLLTSFARHLTFVQLPEMFNTGTTLQRLYAIPKLYHLMLNVPGLLLYEPNILTKTYGEHEGRGGFSSLETLSFGGLQESLCNRLLNLSNFSGLRTLRWYLDEELSNVDAFIRTIVEGCPQLQILDVGHSRMYAQRDARRPVVSWSSIRPILRCVKLRTLMLHCFQVSMNSKDVTELLTNRKTWTGLEIFTVAPLCMSALLIFAQCCPNLKNLGLFVDGCLGIHLTPTETPISFTSLTSMEFAFSHFPEEMAQSVASFFFNFCKEPPYFGGWDLRFWDDVSLALANMHIEQQRLPTGIPMSAYTKEFVAQAMQMKLLMEDRDIDIYGVDSERESGSEDEDEDDMMVDDGL